MFLEGISLVSIKKHMMRNIPCEYQKKKFTREVKLQMMSQYRYCIPFAILSGRLLVDLLQYKV